MERPINNHVQRRGRPRSEEADRAIRTATLRIIADLGIGALSIERVAAEARVAKTTIYRRWNCKEDLIVDAIASVDLPLPELPGTSIREDLIIVAENLRWRHLESAQGPLLAALANESLRHPSLRERYAEIIVKPREAQVLEVLKRGIEIGELRPDLDLELATITIFAPIMQIVRFYPHLRSPETVERSVDMLLRGMISVHSRRTEAYE
ncbi:TetR/AcrR family transcriptional regulator [Nocardia arthritidis]|uniref:TetR/AcrR family transcriptional regulator n=1 Tax=Nocardia arthritidis TaxID=228602 RepID=UPI00142E244C|nr:TetR/AcrR family transcriptional regulator [Nocardia arthritidis]